MGDKVGLGMVFQRQVLRKLDGKSAGFSFVDHFSQ